MKANTGDELIVKGHHQGDAERRGRVIEVHGTDGAPPYVVRWDDGHESLFFPAADSVAHHLGQPTGATPR